MAELPSAISDLSPIAVLLLGTVSRRLKAPLRLRICSAMKDGIEMFIRMGKYARKQQAWIIDLRGLILPRYGIYSIEVLTSDDAVLASTSLCVIANGLSNTDAPDPKPECRAKLNEDFRRIVSFRKGPFAIKTSRFSDEQVAHALRQGEAGTAVTEIVRKLGVSEATFYAWKKKFGTMGTAEIRETAPTA